MIQRPDRRTGRAKPVHRRVGSALQGDGAYAVEMRGWEVIRPPMNGATPVTPLPDDYTAAWQEVYPASWSTTPQRTSHPSGESGGVWWSAILIDCHKSVPALSLGPRRLPDRVFVAALEQALGTRLIETGWLH
jgi:hypothetical protein